MRKEMTSIIHIQRRQISNVKYQGKTNNYFRKKKLIKGNHTLDFII